MGGAGLVAVPVPILEEPPIELGGLGGGGTGGSP